MKNIVALIIITLLCIPLLFACSPAVDGGEHSHSDIGHLADDKFNTDEYLSDYDMDPSYVQFSSARRPLYATDDTAYMYSSDAGLIMYMDKATGICSPLCGKPECAHSDENCNAYVGNSCYALRAYDGKLYWVQGIREYGIPFRLVRSNLDGTSREIMWSIDKNDSSLGFDYYGFIDSFSTDFTIFIHRGYIYFAGMSSNIIGGEMRAAVSVGAMPMDGGKPFMIMQKSEPEYEVAQCFIRPAGNDIYIMLSSSIGRDLFNDVWGSEKLEFYKWSSVTRETEELCIYDSDTPMLGFDGHSFMPVPGDGIYFQKVLEYQRDDGSYASKAIISKCSFTTGEIEDVVTLHDGDFDFFFFISFTKDHIVAESYKHMYVFDYDGNLAAKHELLSEYESAGADCVGADDVFIYYYCTVLSIDDGVMTAMPGFFLAVPIAEGDSIYIE